MTDEERQKLCKELRRPSFHTTEFIRKQAADEIERLVKENEELKKETRLKFRIQEPNLFIFKDNND
jgi:hypothetical protein